MANNPVAGMVSISRNGRTLRVRGNVKIRPLATTKESIVGLDGHHGHKVMPQAQAIEFDATNTADLDLDFIDGGTGAVTAELVNGWTHVLSDAVLVNGAEIDVDNGQATLRFEGPAMRKFRR